MKKMILSVAFVFAASAALAQAPDTVRVRGTIESVDGSMLAVKARDGADMQVKLADNALIRTVTGKTVADVKQGSFVGVTAMPQPDGSQKAIELHIFMEARAAPANFTAVGPEPGSTMTNANVDVHRCRRRRPDHHGLKYPDGEKKFIVPPNTPVVKFEPGSAADLKPGATIHHRRRAKSAGRIADRAGIHGRAAAAPMPPMEAETWSTT